MNYWNSENYNELCPFWEIGPLYYTLIFYYIITLYKIYICNISYSHMVRKLFLLFLFCDQSILSAYHNCNQMNTGTVKPLPTPRKTKLTMLYKWLIRLSAEIFIIIVDTNLFPNIMIDIVHFRTL